MRLVLCLVLLLSACVPYIQYDTSMYAKCWAVELKQPSTEMTLSQAQIFADRVTKAEGLNQVLGIIYLPDLPDQIKRSYAVAAWILPERVIYVTTPTIRYDSLVHELAHVEAFQLLGDHEHDDRFVEIEVELFRKYRL